MVRYGPGEWRFEVGDGHQMTTDIAGKDKLGPPWPQVLGPERLIWPGQNRLICHLTRVTQTGFPGLTVQQCLPFLLTS